MFSQTALSQMFGWVLDVSVICLEKPFTLCTKSRIHRVMVVERYFRRKLLWKSYILSKIMVEFNESHLEKQCRLRLRGMLHVRFHLKVDSFWALAKCF